MDAARSMPTTIDVAFLFLGLPHSQLAGPLRVSQNIAYRTSSAVRYHVVADQAADVLSRQLRLQSRQPWFVHSILKAAPRVEALHSALCARGCAGLNCCKYMWKPLFHLLLPRCASYTRLCPRESTVAASLPTHSPRRLPCLRSS